ncbi:MAG TPA: FAD-dependent oxidoreductase [Streptosporangiaceae bacterium]|nr:FAD-dependent oxidoreductase [Streptosporangiaceae bacterium]
MADANRYPLTTAPISLGPVEIRNRFYLSPHGVGYNVGYEPSDVFVEYYRTRAAGGCGLLVHAMSTMPKRGGGSLTTPYLERTIPSFRAVADAVHGEGSKIFAEIHYSRVGNLWSYEPGSSNAPLFGPSPVQTADDFHVTHEMSVETIGKVVEAHRISAQHLAEAGYDGIELHCAHGMLCEAFLSPYFNRRTDSYGGSMENRMRFLVECLRAAREGAGPDRAIGMRMNADELVPEGGGLTQADNREVVRRLVEAGLLDYLDLDIAIEPDQMVLGMPNYLLPKQTYRSYVQGVREAAGEIPVLSALGRVTSIAEVEEALAAGVADMIGAARGLIAEPDLLAQAVAGRESDSRTCLACNLCMTDGARGTWGCAINPETAREQRWRAYPPAPRPSRVAVVGGGPAGLEAARVAAKRGHAVVLFEREGRVGGQLNLWAALPDREIFGTTPEWYDRQLRQLGVDVRLNTEATADLILAEKPDAILIATGSRYIRTGESGYFKRPVPGWDQDFVVTPEAVIGTGLSFTGSVIVFDEEGITTGPGVAELLAAQGAAVTVVSHRSEPFGNLGPLLITSTMPRLKKLGVQILTRAYLREIGEHTARVYDIDTGAETELQVEAIVMATGRRADLSLGAELAGKAQQVFSIGDALSPRGLTAAIQDGHRFARTVGEPDAPRTFTELYFAPVDFSTYQRPASVLLAE